MARPRKQQTQLNSIGQLVPVVKEVTPVTVQDSTVTLPVVFDDPKLLNLFFINGALNEEEVKTFIREKKYMKLRKLIGKREIRRLIDGRSAILPEDMKGKQRRLLGKLYLYANYQMLWFKKKYKTKTKRKGFKLWK